MRKHNFHPYAAVTIIFWSLAYVLTRLTLRHFSPVSLGFLRYLIASCALAGIAVFTRMKPPRRADLPWFLAAGGAGFFFYMIAFNQGQAAVTAATGSVVIATAPVIIFRLTDFHLQYFFWYPSAGRVRPHFPPGTGGRPLPPAFVSCHFGGLLQRNRLCLLGKGLLSGQTGLPCEQLHVSYPVSNQSAGLFYGRRDARLGHFAGGRHPAGRSVSFPIWEKMAEPVSSDILSGWGLPVPQTDKKSQLHHWLFRIHRIGRPLSHGMRRLCPPLLRMESGESTSSPAQGRFPL